MNVNVLSDQLREFNAWRRGADGPQPNPTEIGELIESAAARLEVLEREHQEFFDRWHDERRKREALEVVVSAAIELVCSPAWAGVSDEDVNLERALRDAGLVSSGTKLGAGDTVKGG